MPVDSSFAWPECAEGKVLQSIQGGGLAKRLLEQQQHAAASASEGHYAEGERDNW